MFFRNPVWAEKMIMNARRNFFGVKIVNTGTCDGRAELSVEG